MRAVMNITVYFVIFLIIGVLFFAFTLTFKENLEESQAREVCEQQVCRLSEMDMGLRSFDNFVEKYCPLKDVVLFPQADSDLMSEIARTVKNCKQQMRCTDLDAPVYCNLCATISGDLAPLDGFASFLEIAPAYPGVSYEKYLRGPSLESIHKLTGNKDQLDLSIEYGVVSRFEKKEGLISRDVLLVPLDDMDQIACQPR
jgi:hypothetical protein